MRKQNDLLEADSTQQPAREKVWDLALRIFHWSLVFAFAIAFITGEESQNLHIVAGYFVGGLLLFRLVWGIIGPKHAKFSDFLYSPSITLSYMRDSMIGRAKRYMGHNPAGSAMVFAMLVILTALTGTGIAMTTDRFWGFDWLEELHEGLASLTLGLIVLHIAGVLFASRENHENLIKSMITGFKWRITEHR